MWGMFGSSSGTTTQSDDRGSVDRKGLGDRAAQLVRISCLESMSPAGAS
jgi:hypothetical protein